MLLNKQSETGARPWANLPSYFITCVNILDRYHRIIGIPTPCHVLIVSRDGVTAALCARRVREGLSSVAATAEPQLSWAEEEEATGRAGFHDTSYAEEH